MDCFKNTVNIYEDPYDCEYTPVEISHSNKENLKTIDIEKIISGLPEDLSSEITIVISVSSNENCSLNPCERKAVKTGLLLKTFLPVTHCLYFEGIINNINVKTESKCVIPIFEKELTINISNFSTKSATIPKQMPLGKLIIKSNN